MSRTFNSAMWVILIALGALAAVVLSACGPARVVGPVPSTVKPAVAAAQVDTAAPLPPAFVAFAKSLQATGASEVTGTAWYPSYLPAGFALTSVETTSISDSGPLCDVTFKKGTSEIVLSQGSPVMRDYRIESSGRVAWGSAMADTMDVDGQPGGASFIVYLDGRNLGELSGDVGLGELERIAASMRPVP